MMLQRHHVFLSVYNFKKHHRNNTSTLSLTGLAACTRRPTGTRVSMLLKKKDHRWRVSAPPSQQHPLSLSKANTIRLVHAAVSSSARSMPAQQCTKRACSFLRLVYPRHFLLAQSSSNLVFVHQCNGKPPPDLHLPRAFREFHESTSSDCPS